MVAELGGRDVNAVMSVAPMTPAATTVAPRYTVAPTTAATPVGKKGDAHEYRTAQASWSSRSYREEKVALRFLREMQADVICAERSGFVHHGIERTSDDDRRMSMLSLSLGDLPSRR